MEILLVQQDLGRRIRAKAVFPLGLGYIAQHIPCSHHTEMYDPNLYPFPESLDILEDKVARQQPDIVGISIKYIDTTDRLDPFLFYATVPTMISRVKKVSPHSRIVVGGAGFSIFPREIMADIPAIDYGVFLEGEESFPELVDNLETPEFVKGLYFREAGRIVFTGSRPPPPFSEGIQYEQLPGSFNLSSYVNNDRRIFGIQTKRGCVFDCAYCNYSYLSGGQYRLRDPVEVVDEIQYLCEKQSLTTFTFADNIFNAPDSHAGTICEELASRNIQVEWSAWLDVKNLSDGFVKLARRAGCRSMEFSPDSSTQAGLDYLGKRIEVGDIHRAVRLARQNSGITYAFNLFCSHPKMTLGEAFQSLTWWVTIPLSIWRSGRLSLGWIRIYPHTRICDVALAEGLIRSPTELFVKSSGRLKDVYYAKPWHKPLDVMFLMILRSADALIKPLAKWLFRLRHQTFPFYYE